MYYQPKVLDKTMQEIPYAPIEDDFLLKVYLKIVDEPAARIILKVCLYEDGEGIKTTSVGNYEYGEVQVTVKSNYCIVIQEHYSLIFVEEEKPMDKFYKLL